MGALMVFLFAGVVIGFILGVNVSKNIPSSSTSGNPSHKKAKDTKALYKGKDFSAFGKLSKDFLSNIYQFMDLKSMYKGDIAKFFLLKNNKVFFTSKQMDEVFEDLRALFEKLDEKGNHKLFLEYDTKYSLLLERLNKLLDKSVYYEVSLNPHRWDNASDITERIEKELSKVREEVASDVKRVNGSSIEELLNDGSSNVQLSDEVRKLSVGDVFSERTFDPSTVIREKEIETSIVKKDRKRVGSGA